MIYADYNATTPVDPRVVEAMAAALSNVFGNPSSAYHPAGAVAAEAVEKARSQVAEALGVRTREVVFTSGATEALNLAVHGVLARENLKSSNRRERVLISATEHKAVLESANYWCERLGFSYEEIGVDDNGVIHPDQLKALVDENVLLVAIAIANNETGVINPIQQLAEITHQNGGVFLTDATQALGKMPLDFSTLNIDLAAVSAHKVYGPKGVGALVGRNKILNHFPSYQVGGGQEQGIRGGTQNVPGIVGFGCAAQLLEQENDIFLKLTTELKAEFLKQINDLIPGTSLNGGEAPALSNTMNIRFEGADGEAVLNAIRGIAISTGSACQTSVPAPSHVLTAMGMDHSEARQCLRISFGRFSKIAEIEEIVSQLVSAVEYVRGLS
jgi:cysteine desulfurase